MQRLTEEEPRLFLFDNTIQLLAEGRIDAAKEAFRQQVSFLYGQSDELVYRLILTSLNRAIFYYFHYNFNLNMSQCCFRNQSLSHRDQDWKLFLQSGEAMLDHYNAALNKAKIKTYRPLYQTIGYIKKHLHEPLTTKQLADQIYYSPASLRKAFKEFTGQSLADFIRNERIERAKLLLRTTHDPIRDIAQACGFNQSYFSTIFKEFEGVSPNVYRKQQGK